MGSAPKAPDPYKQAAAARDENTWAAQYNAAMGNANQTGPYGSVTNTPGAKIPIYDQKGNITGYAPQWNQNTTLSPAQQAIFDQENAAKLGMGKLANSQIGGLQKTLGQPFDLSGLQDWQTYSKGPGLQYEKGDTSRQGIEDAIMASYRRGAEPGQKAEDAQLAARGQSPGGGMAYRVQQGREDATGEATRQAYLASGGESRTAMEAVNKALQQMWLNDNAGADQGNQVRQGQFAEKQQLRNQLINEVSALMGGGQATVMQGQGWSGPQINPFDIAGSQNKAYEIASQNYSNKMSGLFGLGGNLLKMVNPFGAFGAGGMMGK